MPYGHLLRTALFTLAAFAYSVCSLPLHAAQDKNYAPVTHGVAVGDVHANQAVIWSRTDRAAVMHLRLSARGADTLQRVTTVTAEHDYTGKIAVHVLRPDSVYEYQVWFDAATSAKDDASTDVKPAEGNTDAISRDKGKADKRGVTTGTFRTAPDAARERAVTFAWGGDLAGQNVCRDATEGFPIFNAIGALNLDFFVGLGDMIYADNTCDAVGRYGNAQVPGNFERAATLPAFWAHWKYNRGDGAYRALLGKLPYYAIWDDHEVVNDFGPLHDTRGTPPYTAGAHLLPLGLQAFIDYNPIAEIAQTPRRLYRSVRWGKHVELFMLDARQYRDANLTPDDAARPKTMLGREQLVWLKQKLADSDATWKIIVSSVPVSIPTGFPPELGRDGWANFDQNTGFENELLDILRFMQQRGMRNTAWITTDVHFAEVFRYTPFSDDAGFKVYEFVSGPLSAGLFPNHAYDTTLNTESLFFFGPSGDVTRYVDAKPWMNFGLARVDEHGKLSVSIRNIQGAPVYEVTLDPQ